MLPEHAWLFSKDGRIKFCLASQSKRVASVLLVLSRFQTRILFCRLLLSTNELSDTKPFLQASAVNDAAPTDTPKKIVAVLYRGGEAAKNPRLLGMTTYSLLHLLHTIIAAHDG